MFVIYDNAGNELTYWPVSGLAAGDDSAVFVIGVDTPQDSDLTVGADDRVLVMARLNGTSDAFVDIAASPISLRAMSGRVLFDIKLRATMSIISFDRVALSPGTTIESGAAWRG
jgi:hypothetical protein